MHGGRAWAPGGGHSLGHLWRRHPGCPSEETKAVSLLLFLPSTCLQEPEEKKIVQELLETEKAYVARLHLLDQVSRQNTTLSYPGPQHPGLLTSPPLSLLDTS